MTPVQCSCHHHVARRTPLVRGSDVDFNNAVAAASCILCSFFDHCILSAAMAAEAAIIYFTLLYADDEDLGQPRFIGPKMTWQRGNHTLCFALGRVSVDGASKICAVFWYRGDDGNLTAVERSDWATIGYLHGATSCEAYSDFDSCIKPMKVQHAPWAWHHKNQDGVKCKLWTIPQSEVSGRQLGYAWFATFVSKSFIFSHLNEVWMQLYQWNRSAKRHSLWPQCQTPLQKRHIMKLEWTNLGTRSRLCKVNTQLYSPAMEDLLPRLQPSICHALLSMSQALQS